MRRVYQFSMMFATVITVAMSQKSLAQTCSGDVKLSSQAEVDAFNCREVTGRLVISGDNITNLNSLDNLSRAGGLEITNTGMVNLNGLSSLTQVDGGILVSGNPLLYEITGFSGLPSLTGDLTIENNKSLKSVSGFSSLTSVFNGSLSVASNPSLTSLSGFSKLTSVSGATARPDQTLPSGIGLSVTNNTSLTNLDGFSSLQSLSSQDRCSLHITGNSALQNIDGLSKLSSITGAFFPIQIEISDNLSLRNINGFSSLRQIFGRASGTLRIANNAALENIDGLSALRPIMQMLLYIVVENNPSMTKCTGLNPYFEALGWETVLSYYRNGIIVFAENGCTLEDIIANKTQAILKLQMVDTRSHEVVAEFDDSRITLDKANPAFNFLAINAVTLPAQVGSVQFVLTSTSTSREELFTQTTNVRPYELPLPAGLPVGSYEIEVNVYSGPDASGTKGAGLTHFIDVINTCQATGSIMSFDVVDLHGNQLMVLEEGSVISLKDPEFKSFSIRANTCDTEISKVKFILNDQLIQTEYVSPYALKGDVAGLYNSWKARPGSYTLTAIPFTIHDGVEGKGQPLTVHFTVSKHKSLAILSFDVIDTRGQVLRQLSEGDEIDICDPLFAGFSIVANATNATGSVKFMLNDQAVRIENVTPYTLGGDQNGIFTPLSLSPGSYTLIAIPSAEDGGLGGSGSAATINFRIKCTDELAITGFDLVDASGNLLKKLADNDVISLSNPAFSKINVVAHATGRVASVKFLLNGAPFNTENVIPYALAGDNNGRFNVWEVKAGTYTITAEPYTSPNGGGTRGRPLSIRVSVENGNGYNAGSGGNSVAERLVVYPVPATTELFVASTEGLDDDTVVSIFTLQGVKIYSSTYSSSAPISVQDLRPGVYYLQLQGKTGMRTAKIIKE